MNLYVLLGGIIGLLVFLRLGIRMMIFVAFFYYESVL